MKNTKAKTQLLQVLTDAGRALSPVELQASLEGVCDRVTTYRILNRLTKEGLVHAVHSHDGIQRYALCTHCVHEHHHMHTASTSHHVHFSCIKCGTTVCLSSISPSISLPVGYQASEYRFTIVGTCPNCTAVG